jgi:hypothetical protein
MRVQSQMRDITDFEFDLIREDGGPMWKPAACALTAGDIAVRTSINEKNIATYLGRLLKSEQITRPSRGFYMAAGLSYRERIQDVIDILKRCPAAPTTCC